MKIRNRYMYHRIPHNFLCSIFFVTSIYHGLLLFSCTFFHCIFSSCAVLRLDLAYSSIFETWPNLVKIIMYHRIPVRQEISSGLSNGTRICCFILCGNTVQILLLNLVERNTIFWLEDLNLRYNIPQYIRFINNFERSSSFVAKLIALCCSSMVEMLYRLVRLSMNISYVGLQTYLQTFWF